MAHGFSDWWPIAVDLSYQLESYCAFFKANAPRKKKKTIQHNVLDSLCPVTN